MKKIIQSFLSFLDNKSIIDIEDYQKEVSEMAKSITFIHKKSFIENVKFSLKIKKDDDNAKEARNKMVGEVIARGEYISKHGKIDNGFQLGEPKKNKNGHYRYKVK